VLKTNYLRAFCSTDTNQSRSITEVLPEDKIQTLAQAFKDKKESLNALMEKNDKFTWNEARMYKAP
jgi:hypothetical protein